MTSNHIPPPTALISHSQTTRLTDNVCEVGLGGLWGDPDLGGGGGGEMRAGGLGEGATTPPPCYVLGAGEIKLLGSPQPRKIYNQS